MLKAKAIKNRKLRFILALLAGVGFGGLVWWTIVLLGSVSLSIAPGEDGSYAQKITTEEYTLEIRELEHDDLYLEYEPILGWVEILFALWIGIWAFSSTYRDPGAQERRPEYDPRLVTEHPRYAAFVREDSDRKYFEGEELVAAFSSWLSRKPTAQSAGTELPTPDRA